jgi:CheY-like chemotaxis protein
VPSTILVVDDDGLFRAGLRRTLAAAGFRVLQAESGAEALAVLERERPAAVTLDLDMPGLPGPEVLRRIKAIDPSLPVVIVSGSIAPDVERGLREDGAHACLEKGTSTRDLVVAVRAAIEGAGSGATSAILIVDDDPRNVRLLEAILGAAGYRTDQATSGEECLRKVAESKPDLILLDVMMPGTGGLEVCRLLESSPETRSIPVIMVTALSDREDHERAIEAGADDFVTKPIDKGVLLLRVRSLLRTKRYADENRALGELREDFVGMLVHDLGNPLGIVSASLDYVLGRRVATGEDLEALKDARRACEIASHLVQDMVLLAKLERSRIQPKREVLAVEPVVREAVQLQRRCVRAEHVRLDVDAAPVPSIVADASLLRRVLANLLENAMRHSPDGGVVRVSIASGSNAVAIAVSDQGAGIPPHLHAVIFEKFRQIDDASRPARVGRLGLGLAFCKLAVESQGGSIEVVSEGDGCGATFRFTLPIAGSTP